MSKEIRPEPIPIRFSRTELAEVPTDKLSYQHVFYAAIQERYKGRVYISQDGASKNGAKVYYGGGSDLMQIRREISDARIALSTHGFSPILQDVETANWRALLFYIQNGPKKYYELKEMKNVTPVNYKDVVGCFLTAFDRARELSGGILPTDLENIYKGYRSQSQPTTPAILADRVSSIVSNLLQKKKAA